WYINFDNDNDKNELEDIVLHKCYRNPRKILIAAFSLGLGIYNVSANDHNARIIQRLESNEHWESLGFKVEVGDSSSGSSMNISRPIENSASLKNTYLNNSEEIIRVFKFDNIASECEAICDMIVQDIDRELNPEDISVICMDNKYAKTYF